MEKSIYKILVWLLKAIPYFIALIYLVNTIFLIFGTEIALFSIIGYMSVSSLLFLFICSFAFKFCTYHRLPLYYIIANNGLNWLDYLIDFSMSDFNFFILHLIIAGIFILLLIYFKKIRNGS